MIRSAMAPEGAMGYSQLSVRYVTGQAGRVLDGRYFICGRPYVGADGLDGWRAGRRGWNP